MKAFLRAKWPDLLLGLAFWALLPTLYRAVAILFVPADNEYGSYDARALNLAPAVGFCAFALWIVFVVRGWVYRETKKRP